MLSSSRPASSAQLLHALNGALRYSKFLTVGPSDDTFIWVAAGSASKLTYYRCGALIAFPYIKRIFMLFSPPRVWPPADACMLTSSGGAVVRAPSRSAASGYSHVVLFRPHCPMLSTGSLWLWILFLLSTLVFPEPSGTPANLALDCDVLILSSLRVDLRPDCCL